MVFFQNLWCSIVSSRLSEPVLSWSLLSDFQSKRFSALAPPCIHILSNGLCSELLHWNRLSLSVHWTQYLSLLQVTSIKVTHTHTHLKPVTCAIITCHSKLNKNSLILSWFCWLKLMCTSCLGYRYMITQMTNELLSQRAQLGFMSKRTHFTAAVDTGS